MASRASIVRVLRIAVLLTLLGGAAMLFVLNQNLDPRFYRWLESRTGKAMAGIMGWSVEFDFAPTDIPESEMSEEQLAAKRELENLVRQGLPTHRLILQTGEAMVGRVVETTPTHVEFMESYGYAGILSARIHRSRVRALEEVTPSVPGITFRDVLLRLEFPKLEFHRKPPYTVVTDENFFRVQHSVQILRRLHQEFHETFGHLITQPERGEGIQLIFFGEEKEYQSYAEQYAPLLEHTSGFYSPKLDRLTVFNQITSKELKAAKNQLVRKEKLHGRGTESDAEKQRLREWRSNAERSILRHAQLQTEATLRHEGTHQLMFTYGVHSTHHAENTWLIEGLAVYCESARLGDLPLDRVGLLKARWQESDLIPIPEIVNSRSPRGFFVFGNEERVSLAYAESWALVHFLMQPQRRNDFFRYIRYVRDPDNLDSLADHPRFEILAAFLDLTSDDLLRQWNLFVQRL